jgi:hypothetical protein
VDACAAAEEAGGEGYEVCEFCAGEQAGSKTFLTTEGTEEVEGKSKANALTTKDTKGHEEFLISDFRFVI